MGVLNFQVQSTVSFVAVMVPLGYSAIMLGIVYWIVKRKDL
jgi:hypothetical protein